MDKSIIDDLNNMDDITSTSKPSEEGLNKPIFKALGEILYDTVVTSTKEYVAETEVAGQKVTAAFAEAQKAGVPMDYFDDMALTPELTDVQQQIADNVESTLTDARMQALKDPVTVGGTIVAGATGQSYILPLVTSPFIIRDALKATEQGQGGKAALNLALPIFASTATNMLGWWGKTIQYAPKLAKFLQNPMTSALVGTGAALTDEGTREWAIQHPGRAAFMFAGADAIRGGKQTINKYNGKSSTATETKTTANNEGIVEGDTVLANKEPTKPKVDADGFEEREGMIKPTETRQKPKTLAEEAFPENMEENVKTQEQLANHIAEETLEAQRTPSVMQGAYDETLTFSTSNLYDGLISVDGIWKTAQKIAPALPGKLKRKAEGVLGYFKPKTEGITVKGFTSWSVLCHETGHALSKKTGFGRGNPAIEAELKNGALSIWKSKEYGDPSTPKGHSTYIEEGRAAFMNEYLINPEQAKKHFPLTYADFETRLAQDAILQAQVELLGQQIRKWGNGNAWDKVNASNSYGSTPTLMETINKKMLDVETAVVDELAPLYKVTKDFLMQHPDTQMDKDGNITKTPKTITMEENPGHIAQRAKESINAITQDLMGKSGIDTPTIIQAVANRFQVALNPVTLLDVFDPIRALAKKIDVKTALGSEDIKDWYEGFSAYMVAKHTLEVITVKNAKRVKNLEEKINTLAPELAKQAQEIANDKAKGIDVTQRELQWHKDYDALIAMQKNADAIRNGLDDYLTPLERKEYEQVVAEGNKIPELVQASKLLHDFNENVLRIAVKGDMLKQVEADTFLKTYSDYIPLQRSFAIEGNNRDMRAIASDKTYANIDKAFKSLSEEGSARTVKDPIAQYALNLQSLISKIERNKVAKAVVKLSKMEGGDNLLRKAGTNGTPLAAEQIITVWDKGVQSSYNVVSPALYEALAYADKATQVVQLNALEALTQGAATTLRKGATSTITFAMANMFKDLFNATCLNKDGRKTHLPVVDQALLLWDGVMGKLDKQLNAEYKAEGVQFTTSIGNGRQINYNMREYINDTSLRMSRMGKLVDTLLSITDVGEQLPRMGLYRRARLRGASPFEAACIASDGTTNFMRSGSQVKRINRNIPFFNAVIQGDSKILRELKADPVGVGLACFTYVTIPALYCWSRNHDKDWYKNTPLSIKNQNFLIDLSTAQDGSMVLKLPKNEFIGYFFGSLPERFLDFCVENDRDGAVLSQSVKDTFGQLAPSGFPPSLLWYIEARANYSYFRGQKIVDDRSLKLKPKDQYNVYTSEVAKGTASALDKVGIAASPMIIDNTIYDLTGTMGYLVNGGIDIAVRAASNDKVQRPSRKWTEWTRFTYTKDTAKSRSSDVFFKGLDDLEAEYGSAVKNAGKGDRPPVPEKLQEMRRAKKAAMDISASIKQLDGMEMDGDTKRAERDKLVIERDNIYKYANKTALGYDYINAPSTSPYAKPPKKKKAKSTHTIKWANKKKSKTTK